MHSKTLKNYVRIIKLAINMQSIALIANYALPVLP